MARRAKAVRARKPTADGDGADDDSLLRRSAESLGRIIGALQRQLDETTTRLAHTTGAASPTRVRTTKAKKAKSAKKK